MKTKQINLVKQVKYVLLIAVLSLMACKQDKTESMPEKADEIEISKPKINLQEAVKKKDQTFPLRIMMGLQHFMSLRSSVVLK